MIGADPISWHLRDRQWNLRFVQKGKNSGETIAPVFQKAFIRFQLCENLSCVTHGKRPRKHGGRGATI